MKLEMHTCPKVPLTELLSFIVDNRGKTVPTADTGHVLIATNCIKNEALYPVFEKVRYLSDETYKTWFRSHPQPGDIIFVNKGTPGRVCMVPDPVNFCIAQDMIALRVDDSKIYNKYLFATLRWREIQAQIYNTNVGDVIPHFKKSFLDELLIPLPSMEIQRGIGDLYFDLSEKVANNTKINHHLEQVAQAIFKSWFVDFEPFGGKMPDDWLEGTISDLGDVIGGSTPSKAKPEYYTEHGIAWITPKDLSVNKSKFIAHGADDITELGLRNSSARLMPRGTVLFSSRAPIGYIAIASSEVCTNQGFKSIVPKESVGTAFIFYFLIENLKTIENMASGSTFKEVSGSTMKNIPAIIPDDDTLRRFQEECTPIFEKQELLEAENTHLAEIRDSLLPRLISGELSVSDLATK